MVNKKDMEIVMNKQISEILYKTYTPAGDRIEIAKNGEILNIADLTSPMRDNENVHLSKKESHITFYNGSDGFFIPIADIIAINYA